MKKKEKKVSCQIQRVGRVLHRLQLNVPRLEENISLYVLHVWIKEDIK
jgi:hypothetical protein